MKIISATIDLLANLFGFARKRQELNNSPEMQARARAATDQKLKDEAAAAVANRDTDSIRKHLSE